VPRVWRLFLGIVSWGLIVIKPDLVGFGLVRVSSTDYYRVVGQFEPWWSRRLRCLAPMSPEVLAQITARETLQSGTTCAKARSSRRAATMTRAAVAADHGSERRLGVIRDNPLPTIGR
jgi:hypothetical protein